MKHLIYILTVLALPLMALQCKKDNPVEANCQGDIACELAKLPPATTEGKGTFGCLVNGKAWLPKGDRLWGGSLFIDLFFMLKTSIIT